MGTLILTCSPTTPAMLKIVSIFSIITVSVPSLTWNVTSIDDYKSEMGKTKEPEDLMLQGLSWDLDVICEKNEVDDQDEWLNLGGGGVEWDLTVLCSANKEDPDILYLEGESWTLNVVCSKSSDDYD